MYSVDLEDFEGGFEGSGNEKTMNPQLSQLNATLMNVRNRFLKRAKQSLEEQLLVGSLLRQVDYEIQKVGDVLYRQVERDQVTQAIVKNEIKNNEEV